MENPDPNGAVSHLVAILRKITRVVQLLPFAYLLLFASYLLCESVLPDAVVCLADNVLNTPIIAIIVMLGAGRLLRLCNWFKTACLLPITTKVEGYIDAFVFTFTQEEIILINTTIGILCIVFIILSYRHFFAHGQ